jgi:thiol-disulfide isomerase/thioredoxin
LCKWDGHVLGGVGGWVVSRTIQVGAIIVALTGALAAVTACGGSRDASAGASADSAPSGLLESPYVLEPLVLQDLDGTDRSTPTWNGRIVIINVWATWCGPCRREMPYFQRIQARFGDRLLLIGLLDDTVSIPYAREFLKVARVQYPVVVNSFEIQSKLPATVMLPMTYIIDHRARLAAMYAGEVPAAAFESDLATVFDRASIKKP